MKKSCQILEKLLMGILGIVLSSIFFAIYFFEIRFTFQGMCIGSIKIPSLIHLEQIQVRYQKDQLIVDIDTAYVYKKALEGPSNAPVFSHIAFSIKNGFFQNSEGHADQGFAFTLDYSVEKPLSIVVEQKLHCTIYPKQVVALQFDHVHIEELKDWGKHFVVHPSFEWISQGVINGGIQIDLPKQKLIDGELFIENVVGGDIASSCNIFLEKIHLSSDQKVEVKNGSVRIVEPLDGYDFGVENVSGMIWGDLEHGIRFDLDGLLRQGVDKYPLFFEGFRGKDTILEADASLLLDEGSNLKKYFHISLENPEEGTVILKGLFDHVVESEYHALKQLFKPEIPFLDSIHVASMQVSFELKGVWEQGHLVSITAEDILGDFLVGFYDQPPIPLTIEARYSEAGLFTGQVIDGISRGILDLSLRGDEGSFEGTDLSAPLLNGLLTPFRDGWSLRGNASVLGKLCAGETQLQLFSEDLTFVDANIEFLLTKKPLKGEFLITKEGDVQGLLNCVAGELSISGLLKEPLVFEDLFSAIRIHNEEVYLEKIEAVYRGIELGGELSLHPISTGGQRLLLSVDYGKGSLHGLRVALPNIPLFLDGNVELQNRGFSLEADLVDGGDCHYQIDLRLKEGTIGGKEDPYTYLEADLFHSTWEDRSSFDVLLTGEAVDWFRLAGTIEHGFCFFDTKNTHLFQKPFKQLEGGEKAGGIAFQFDREELQTLATLFRVNLPFSSVEGFIGFRNFSELIAANLKLDEQEISFIKDKDLATLKKGEFAFSNSKISFEDLCLDLNESLFSTEKFTFAQEGSTFAGRIERGSLMIEEASYLGVKMESLDPSRLEWDDWCLKLQGGTVLFDNKHKLHLSGLNWDLFAGQGSLKTSKLDLATEISGLERATGWVKGEWGADQRFLDYKMTPFSTLFEGQSLQVDSLSGLLSESGFKLAVEGKVNQLQYKSVLHSHLHSFDRWHWSVESDLGRAFLDVSRDPKIGWVLHETKGDLLGLVWSLAPHGELRDPKALSVIGSLIVDPLLFTQGLNTFKIPVKMPFQIEKPLQLNGVCTLLRDLSKGPTFHGDLTGRYLKVEGVNIRNLSMQLHLEDGLLECKKIHAVDGAFDLSVDSCKVHLDSRDLLFEGITLIDFKPAQWTKEPHEDPFMIKELVIPTLFVQTKKGLELKGKGELYFINQEMRTKNIFDLPRDFLAVLGLDPSLLVPVSGQVEFSFERDKIFLDRLRRTYSDQARSSFFLDPNAVSYIALDGSLSIRMRMKQSALLRLAEPFVIAIDGSIGALEVQLQ